MSTNLNLGAASADRPPLPPPGSPATITLGVAAAGPGAPAHERRATDYGPMDVYVDPRLSPLAWHLGPPRP